MTENKIDKNTIKRRLLIGSGINKKTGKSITERRRYLLKLSKTEIAIIKGALEYWLLDHDFGYALWNIQAAVVSNSDTYYRRIVVGLPEADGLWDTLKRLCKVKSNYGGYWGNIDRLDGICRKEIDEIKKQAEEFEKEYGIDYATSMIMGPENFEQFRKGKEKKTQIDNK